MGVVVYNFKKFWFEMPFFGEDLKKVPKTKNIWVQVGKKWRNNAIDHTERVFHSAVEFSHELPFYGF